MEVAVILCLGLVWVIATLIVQFSLPLSRSILSRDYLGILPIYTFFAPKPTDIDLHILIRFMVDDQLSDWEETELTFKLNHRKKWFRWMINPYRRIEKLLFDFSNDIFKLKTNPGAIRHLDEYIILLRYSETLAKLLNAKAVQFMLAGDNPTLNKKLEVFLISDLHQCHHRNNNA